MTRRKDFPIPIHEALRADWEAVGRDLEAPYSQGTKGAGERKIRVFGIKTEPYNPVVEIGRRILSKLRQDGNTPVS